MPRYVMAMPEVLGGNLGRGGESWELQKRAIEEFPYSEIVEAWCRTHRTSRWQDTRGVGRRLGQRRNSLGLRGGSGLCWRLV